MSVHLSSIRARTAAAAASRRLGPAALTVALVVAGVVATSGAASAAPSGHHGASSTGGSRFVTAGAPTVSGQQQVGHELTVDPGTWSPSDVTFTYQWFRGETAIAGATAATYTPVARDAVQLLTVVVTGTSASDGSSNSNSYRTGYIEKGDLVETSTPTVTGRPKAGKTLTLRFQPPSGAAVGSVYWCRDGDVKAIKDAHATTYVPTKKDVGHTLTLVFLVTKSGYYSDRFVVKLGKVSG